MSTITIQKISITDLGTDAIVNAANEGLWAGGGVCGAIFRAAGHGRLQKACDKIGHCDTGSAVITPGFDLKAKYIIHAVGPRWSGGNHKEPEQLYGAYYKALELALENDCTSIGFPLISAGIFGYPIPQAWERAIAACGDFLDRHKDVSMDIVFAVLSDEIIAIGERELQNRKKEVNVSEPQDVTSDPRWERAVQFHGHICPGLMIGFRASLYAAELLGVTFSKDEEIVCIAENDSCSVDAIQSVLGCTIGKGNLLFHMRGKQAFSFYNRNTGRSVRLVQKNSDVKRTREESFAFYSSCSSEEIFDVKETTITLPEEAKIFESYECECCGEKTGANWIRIMDGKKVCLDCMKEYDRLNI